MFNVSALLLDATLYILRIRRTIEQRPTNLGVGGRPSGDFEEADAIGGEVQLLDASQSAEGLVDVDAFQRIPLHDQQRQLSGVAQSGVERHQAVVFEVQSSGGVVKSVNEWVEFSVAPPDTVGVISEGVVAL